jgi:2-dehydropantoate 2-reductase
MGRYIIYGAGAVGGLIAARLQLSWHDVAVVARGAHRDSILKQGLRLRTPVSDQFIKLRAVAALSELSIHAGDTIILAMKTQDVQRAINELTAIAPPDISVVCAQNGIESERIALRNFEHVYGVYVVMNSALMEPGIISSFNNPCMGILDLGHYPRGCDDRATAIAADLTAAGFSSIARQDIMRWKRAKFVVNIANAVQASCTSMAEAKDILDKARDEAEACLRAAKLEFASAEEFAERSSVLSVHPIDGRTFPGGSTFQSLARGTGETEVDYLTGEVVLMGRLHGVSTPTNSFLQRLIHEMVHTGATPGSIPPAELRRRIGVAQGLRAG